MKKNKKKATPIKISFFGPSGSGKTTAVKIAEDYLCKKMPDYWATIVNVSEPLHQIQRHAYETLHLGNNGQDGKLLQLLANHFEKHLGPRIADRAESFLGIVDGYGILINGDCRNNAYSHLKKCGFIFIRVKTKPEIIQKRLGKRGDVSAANKNDKVEQIDKMKADYTITNNDTKESLEEQIKRILDEIVCKK